MKWVILVVLILVVLLVKRLKSNSTQTAFPNNLEKKKSKSTILRQGRSIKADEVFHAWTKGKLSDMSKVLDRKTNPIDRHFLLMGIVDEAYRNRRDDENAVVLKEVAEMHIAEFPKIKPALKKEMNGVLPRVTTFQKYATLLTEIGEFERAIEVCEKAIEHGLHDGTKTGFEGRIERIRKKMQA